VRGGAEVAQQGGTDHNVAIGGRPTLPPDRPRTEDVRDLGFRRRDPVVWYSPRVLADSGLRYVLSAVFGAYLDKRELQAALPSDVITHHADRDELWFDFVADTGDGFDATHSIAWLLGKRQLEVEGHDAPLPRGDLLVLGGDEVYPTASAEAYEDRFVGPFTSALPWSRGTWPDLYAIPGNHDWFDGLTSFMRIFCQQKIVGGWETWQHRSYFAVQLPHRWWLWGLDIQFDSYIDEPQLRYFDAVPLEPGDRVILCSAQPTWVDVPGDPEEYRNLAYVERKLIVPKGARHMVSLTGDLHHYARYSAEDGTHKITAGGGGAFMHPTHDLPEELDIDLDPARSSETTRYRLQRCFPDKRTSKLLALRSPLLPFKNVSFVWLAGVFHALLLVTTLFSLSAVDDQQGSVGEVLHGLDLGALLLAVLRNPTGILIGLLVVAVMYAFADPPPVGPRARKAVRFAMAAVHAALHLLAIVVGLWLSVRAVGSFADGNWLVVWLFVVVVVLGGFLSGVVFGIYLIAANLLPFLRTHGNETFSSLRYRRYKNLLRLHIDREGVLSIHAIGLRRVCTDWELDPDATDPEASWFRPTGDPPEPRLIDEVVRVDGRPWSGADALADASRRAPAADMAPLDGDSGQP
jgi:hypothetical protein